MNEKLYFLFYLYLEWESCVEREYIKAIANKIYPNKVVCINRPGDLLIGLLRRRERLRSSLPGANIHQITNNLILIRPLFLLNDYLASWVPGLNGLQCVWLRWLLKRMSLEPAYNERVIIWLFSPVHWQFAKLFPSAFVVSHLVDEYTITLQGRPKRHMLALEQRMLKRSNIVFTLSRSLAQKKSYFHNNVFCIGQGVAFEQFAKAVTARVQLPKELSEIPRPRIGLVGNIRDWIDFSLVKTLLVSRPDWSIIFIGPIDPSATGSVAKLNNFKNFYWLGPKPFQEIPYWIAGLDVGIIPYLHSEFTKYVNPAKLYEYLAVGLPVVMTNIGEFQKIDGCLWVTETPDGFIQAICEALKADDLIAKQVRIQLAKNHSWENVSQRALEYIFALISKE